MSNVIVRLSSRGVVVAVLVAALLVVPGVAGADVSSFERLEATATANYVVAKQCSDGTTVQQRTTVIGGHEEETQDGVRTLASDFVTVLIRGFTCDGSFISDRGSGPAEFSYSPSLREASVSGSLTTNGGRTVDVDMAWEGTGPVHITSNTTTFPGFTGHFRGKRRAAVATGSVVVNGETLVDGSTSNADIETLHDKNISTA
jgi:hypothetical protein